MAFHTHYFKIIWCFENDFENKTEFQMYNYKIRWGFIYIISKSYGVSKMISKIKQRNKQNSVSDFSLFFAT